MWIEAEAGKGKFAHIDPADGNHARSLQRLDHIRILLRGRRIREHDRSSRRRQAGDVEEVLPGDGYAVDQSARTPFPQSL
ncbi:hypothetical protein GA0061102_105728 [Rhizobium miluonense]|uniref:Uncharacterized protein n=1 Tax=Rhizobium miluonense TaxID=411945 RepID=A0A1C3X4I4_9HYPH|nr:hypothetical protein GA0061102_105728 [Rhizobium miluonense]